MPPVALRQSKDAKPRAAAFVPASARMARATNSNATAFFPPSEAADDVVAVCTAPSFALDMIGEEREVLLDLTLLWRLGAVPGDVVTSRLLVDGVQSTLKLVWTWPKDYCRVDSFIYLVVDDKMGPEIPFLYHRGCRREQNEEKTLLIILSKLDSTSMSMESQCAGWPVADLPPRPRQAVSRPRNTAPRLLPSLSSLQASPTGGAKRASDLNSTPPAKRKTSVMGGAHPLGPGAPSPGVTEQTPEDAAWQLRVADRQAQRFHSPLSKLGRPSKVTRAAAETEPAGPSSHPRSTTLSAGGTGQLDDAGHGEGYHVYMGYYCTPIPAYRSQLGALALSLSGTATAWGAPNPGSWVSNLTRNRRHIGEPWVDRVWNAFHYGIDCEHNPRLNFARVDVVLELTRHFWENTQLDTKQAFPYMEMVLEELEALVALEQLPQHLENPADTLIIQGAPKAGPALLMTTGDTAGTSGAGTAVAARGCAASVRK